MKTARISLSAFFVLAGAAALFAQGLPFKNLTEAEKATLLRGESVFRQPNVWKELSVPPSAPFAKDVEDTVRKLGANYIGEVIMVVPKASHPEFLLKLVRDLQAVEHHVGIPYWSKRNKRYYDLYSRVTVKDRTGTELKGSLTADENMEPFDDFSARYTWSLTGDRLSFLSTNLTHLAYDGKKAVSPGDMVWRMETYSDGDAWVLYGIGAVKAFDMFGLLRDRLSASFMGRIEAFFSYMYGKR
jgi:hypothetical protein